MGTSRKRKSSDAGDGEDGGTTKDDESSVKKAKFDWDEVITACLKEKDSNEMKLVKLKKKCLREYFSAHEGTHKTKEEIGAKFDKEVMKGAPTKPEGWQSATDPKPVISFNKWEGADM